MVHACRPAPEAKAEGKVMARERLRRRSGLGYILRKLQKKRVRVNGKRVRPEMQHQSHCPSSSHASAFTGSGTTALRLAIPSTSLRHPLSALRSRVRPCRRTCSS